MFHRHDNAARALDQGEECIDLDEFTVLCGCSGGEGGVKRADGVSRLIAVRRHQEQHLRERSYIVVLNRPALSVEEERNRVVPRRRFINLHLPDVRFSDSVAF